MCACSLCTMTRADRGKNPISLQMYRLSPFDCCMPYIVRPQGSFHKRVHCQLSARRTTLAGAEESRRRTWMRGARWSKPWFSARGHDATPTQTSGKVRRSECSCGTRAAAPSRVPSWVWYHRCTYNISIRMPDAPTASPTPPAIR
jgi:hypothetical protein